MGKRVTNGNFSCTRPDSDPASPRSWLPSLFLLAYLHISTELRKYTSSQKESTLSISTDNFMDCTNYLDQQLKENIVFKINISCNWCCFFFRTTFQTSDHFWTHLIIGLDSSVKRNCQAWIRFSNTKLRKRTARNHYNLFYQQVPLPTFWSHWMKQSEQKEE